MGNNDLKSTITVDHFYDLCSVNKQAEKIIVRSTQGVTDTFNFKILSKFNKETEILFDCKSDLYFSDDMLFYRAEDKVSLVFCFGKELDVVIPEGVNEIGPGAFQGLDIRSVFFPESLKKIGFWAFMRCNSLVNIKLSKNLIRIGPHVFSQCANLRSVELPENLLYIDNYAFFGCENLQAIQFPEQLIMIDNHAFYECKRLRTLKFPPHLQSIGLCAFWGCQNLTSVEGFCREIGSQAFYKCRSLINVKFEEGLERIGKDVFCFSGLKEITLPSSVYSTGERSLAGVRCVHVKQHIYNLIEAIANCSLSESCCIDCGEDKIILPSFMSLDAKKEANICYLEVVTHQRYVDNHVLALYHLGSTSEAKCHAAFSAYKLSRDEALKNYIKHIGIELINDVGKEEELLELLDIFREIGFPEGMLKKGYEIAEENNWFCAVALILQLSGKPQKPSFSL